MSLQTQLEIPLGIKMLEVSAALSVRVGMKNPRGKYAVMSEGGEVFFSSTEALVEYEVACGGGKRLNSFYIDLLDGSNKQVISYRRPPSCEVKMQVRMGGVLVATVHQAPTLRKPILIINDMNNKPVLRIKGPVAYKGKCDFDLQTMTKQSIGAVTKQCGQQLQDVGQDYMLTFPRDLDVKCKAAVLGACFLIDFACFEESWF